MTPETPAARRILVVDDEPLMARSLDRHFRRQGCSVRIAASLAEAAGAAGEGPWDLVLLDVSLPDGSGLALITRLRAAGPILLMTGESHAIAPDGVSGIIHKPFDLPELERKVRALWDQRARASGA
jgi:two-component system response regulator TctD